MTTRIIDGRAVARSIRLELTKKLAGLEGAPGLAIIQIGTNPASEIYIKVKERACRELGITFKLHRLSPNTLESEVLERIKQLNAQAEVHGIVVQLPLPRHLNEDRVIEAIDWRKDVDGFHPFTISNLLAGKPVAAPGLVRGIVALIKSTRLGLKGKRAAVLANADTFVKPLAFCLERAGATVQIVKSGQPHRTATRSADVVIIAYGRPGFLIGRDIKEGSVLIDVGITRQPDGSVAGDVDRESVQGIAGWLTPVPGGVGPVTVAELLDSTVDAYANQLASLRIPGRS